LNAILNSRRNAQLNEHGVMRVRPFYKESTATVPYPTLIPYKFDTTFEYE
jgi:hypothetical protein